MYRVEPRWYIRTRIQEGEILSSWLIRSALDMGCSPLTLVNILWGKWRALTIDVDRGLNSAKMAELLIHCFELQSSIEQTMLSSYFPVLASSDHNKGQPIPWLLVLGNRNRSNISGHQVCTQCLNGLSAPPYLRLQWRMGWHSGCWLHRTTLIDHCPQCGTSIQPKKIDIEHGSLAICSSCYIDLGTFIQCPAEANALCFQNLADQVFSTKCGLYNEINIPSIEWFEIARAWLSFIRSPINMKSPNLLRMFESFNIKLSLDFPVTPLAFEYLKVHEREKLLSLLNQIMLLPCELIVERSLKYGVSRSYFWDKRKKLPIQLQVMKDQMLKPSKIILSGESSVVANKPKSKESVQRKWLRLSRKLGKEGLGDLDAIML
ncbi:TniQ family protein [Acinetobacter baumannii]|uniref:TniQ family protein n=1 Tax=Acinetobacter baumannii TaxID=470 RepID=UPI000BF40AEE|nr:TniQ family protein [Acinetobacter baumannii]